MQESFNAAVQANLQGADPDLVVVIEIAGSVSEFFKAAAHIEGLEWIGEWEADGIDPSEDFSTKHEGEQVSASLFLMFSNQRAMQELLSLWRRYSRNPNEAFARGLAKWKNVFAQLHAIRLWDERDRVSNALLEDWDQRLQGGAETMPFEAELWFFHHPDKRAAAERDLRAVIEGAGGRVIGQCTVEEIEYQAVVGELPARTVRDVYADRNLQLFRTREVMYVRPVGQAFVPAPAGDLQPYEAVALRPPPAGDAEAIVAILDGMPIESHPLLDRRLIVDDPDGWADLIPANSRFHGTAMASLVVHGDLTRGESPLSSPVYVRPILQPDGPPWGGAPRESIPDGVLFVDLLHRAIVRLFETKLPRVGRVYVINVSIGDRSRPFARSLSPCARLLDWLAWKYQVVIVVSAGNHGEDLVLEMPRHALAGSTQGDIEREILRSIDRDSIHRRLLSPAESINSLTIGATYDDGSTPTPIAHSVLAYDDAMPSPYNAQGLGYRRSVKPDVLFSGGRILLRETLAANGAVARAEMMGMVTRSPGQLVAAPPAGAMLTPAITHSRGTSNACAIATRNVALAFDVLRDARAIDAAIPDEFIAVALKTLVVHGASWGNLAERYEAALTANPSVVPPFSNLSDYITKYLGNGVGNFQRAVHCDAKRVTLLGYGMLSDDAADVFTFPLPQGLSGQTGLRRLIVTLSWLTPVNPRHYNYRRAQLWFSFPDDGSRPDLLLPAGRAEVHAKPSQRGTVQHEVFSGEDARVFRNKSAIRIWVNCRADAGELEDEVPYCLAVTLEVGENVNVPIYQQVQQRIRQAVRVRPG